MRIASAVASVVRLSAVLLRSQVETFVCTASAYRTPVRFLAVESAVVVLAGLSNPALRWNRKESAMLFRELMTQLVWHRSKNHRIEVFRRKNKGPGARAGHFPSFFSLFYTRLRRKVSVLEKLGVLLGSAP